MKLLLTLAFMLLNINFNFLPKPDLLLIMGIAMLLDFATGFGKAILLREPRTSTGFRKTIIKFIQYGGAILIGMGISYLGQNVQEYNKTWLNITQYMSWFNGGLLIFIIFIEIISILENLYAMNRTSLFSKYVISPTLRVLTIQLKSNPLTTITIQTEDEEITKDSVKVEEKAKA